MQSHNVQLGSKDLRAALAACLQANLVAMIHGSPGTAKTAIVNQLAKDNDLEVIIFSLVSSEPADLLGLPSIRKGTTSDSDRAVFTPSELFPLDDQPLPKGKKGWVTFFDEASAGSPELQAACLKLVHERLVGNRKLHPNAFIVMAGNYTTDKAYSNHLISSLGSRVVHLHATSNPTDWLEYATGEGYDWRVLSYISEHPNRLHVFDPSDKADNTFPCYRTWEAMSDFLKTQSNINPISKAVMQGIIGVAAATEFLTYLKVAAQLPKRDDIINDPDSINVPVKNVAVCYLLAYQLVDICQQHHFGKFLGLFHKFSPEMQFLIFRAWARKPGVATAMEVQEHPALQDWVMEMIRIKQS